MQLHSYHRPLLWLLLIVAVGPSSGASSDSRAGGQVLDKSNVAAWKAAGVFSASAPGPHGGSEAALAPEFKVNYGTARIVSKQAVDAHWVENADGEVLAFRQVEDGANEWDAPVSRLSMMMLPDSAIGELHAYAHSDEHGTWRATLSVESHATHHVHSEL
jgi:hypothetical protein